MYNRSEIMKAAHIDFKLRGNKHYTFSDCLKNAWRLHKKEVWAKTTEKQEEVTYLINLFKVA